MVRWTNSARIKNIFWLMLCKRERWEIRLPLSIQKRQQTVDLAGLWKSSFLNLCVSERLQISGQRNRLNPLPSPQLRIWRSNTSSLLLSDKINMKGDIWKEGISIWQSWRAGKIKLIQTGIALSYLWKLFFQVLTVVFLTTICTFTVLSNRFYNILASWPAKKYLDWFTVPVQYKGKQMDRWE